MAVGAGVTLTFGRARTLGGRSESCGEQQRLRVEAFEHADGADDGFDDDPRVTAGAPAGSLLPFVSTAFLKCRPCISHRSFFASRSMQPRRRFRTSRAGAAEIGDDDEAGRAQVPYEFADLVVCDAVWTPETAIQAPDRRRVEMGGLCDGDARLDRGTARGRQTDRVRAGQDSADVQPVDRERAVVLAPSREHSAPLAQPSQVGGHPLADLLLRKRRGPATCAPLLVLGVCGQDVLGEVLGEPQRPCQQVLHGRLGDARGAVLPVGADLPE